MKRLKQLMVGLVTAMTLVTGGFSTLGTTVTAHAASS